MEDIYQAKQNRAVHEIEAVGYSAQIMDEAVIQEFLERAGTECQREGDE